MSRNTRPIRVKGEEDAALYRTIAGIVDGSGDTAETLEFEPGTLSIFCGSRCLHEVCTVLYCTVLYCTVLYCLHEVTRVRGHTDRLVAVFCFATRPGVRNSAQVQQLFWGRTVD